MSIYGNKSIADMFLQSPKPHSDKTPENKRMDTSISSKTLSGVQKSSLELNSTTPWNVRSHTKKETNRALYWDFWIYLSDIPKHK